MCRILGSGKTFQISITEHKSIKTFEIIVSALQFVICFNFVLRQYRNADITCLALAFCGVNFAVYISNNQISTRAIVKVKIGQTTSDCDSRFLQTRKQSN